MARKIKHITVAEFIEKLKKLKQDVPICIEIYEKCMTESGTDMGGYDEYQIDIADLDTRVVLTGVW